MNQYRQKKRVKEFNSILNELNSLEQAGIVKGKALKLCMSSFLCGYMLNRGTPDPVIYFAVIRGGDPRIEIENGIKIISKTQ